MVAMADNEALTELERNAYFPTIQEAMECLIYSDLVNKVKSLQYKDIFHQATTNGPVAPHFFERNSVGGTGLVITSESLKLLCIVFGCSETTGYWEERKTCSMQQWGPKEKPFSFGEEVKINTSTNESLFSDEFHKNVYEGLNNVIKIFPNYKVVVTGIGQGGAMSTVFSTFLGYKKPTLRIHNITFGSPRIGGIDFKKWANTFTNINFWRFVLNNDVVVGIPSMTMGYRHIGHVMHFDSKRSSKAYFYNRSDEETEDMIGLSKPPEFLTPLSQIVEPLKDHSAHEYIQFMMEHAIGNPKLFFPKKFDAVFDTGAEMTVMERVLSLCS